MGMDVQFFWSKNQNQHSCSAEVDFRQWRKDYWIEALIEAHELGESVSTCERYGDYTFYDARVFRKLYKDDLIKLKNFYHGEGNDEKTLSKLPCFYEDLVRDFYKFLNDDQEKKKIYVKNYRRNVEFC